jgi:heat shock protein HslJ
MRGDRHLRHRAAPAALATLVAVLAMTLGACSSAGTPATSAAPSGSPDQGTGLAGREFLSTAVTDGGAPFALVPGTQIRLTFRDTDLSASAGCNIIGGQYRVADGRLVFTGGAMTEMACQGGRDAQDSWLIGILGSNPAITLVGNDLTLQAGTLRITLLDREVATPDQPLVGPQWVVVGIIAGDTVSSVPMGVFATLAFDASGQVTVAAGCNDGSGSWVARDGTIAISDLALTKKACPPPAGTVETAIVEVLRAGSLTFQIDASSMTLSAGGRGLQLQVLGPD